MTDFFDWLTAGDAGLSLDRLADDFDLSQLEMRRVIEALAPAFAAVLGRLAMDGPGGRAGAVEGFLAREFGDALFGSRRAVRAVARSASPAAGIAPDAVEELVDALCVLSVRVMFRSIAADASRDPAPAVRRDGPARARNHDVSVIFADALALGQPLLPPESLAAVTVDAPTPRGARS